MNFKFIKDSYRALPHSRQVIIWLVTGVLLLLFFIYGGGYLRDKWDQRKYEQTIAIDAKRAKDAETIRDQALVVAQQKNEESKEWQRRADELQKQLNVALEVLADDSKTAQQKREVYNQIKDRTAPIVVTRDNSIDELCQRAAAAGIKCSP
jgi:hypothetical protein